MAAPAVTDWASGPGLVLPPDSNGVGEVGIAAGADEISNAQFHIKILTQEVMSEPQVVAARSRPSQAMLAYRTTFDADLNDGKIGCDDAMFTPDFLAWIGVASRDEIKGTTTFQTLLSERRELPPQPTGRRRVWLSATLAVLDAFFEDAEISLWYIRAVSYLITSGWIVGPQGNNNVTYLSPQDSAALYGRAHVAYAAGDRGVSFNTREKIQAALSHGRSTNTIATQIIATKITYWQTNHHVGQVRGKIASYAGKVIALDESLPLGEPLRTALWALGKYCVTIRILECCGIKGMLNVYDTDSYGRPGLGAGRESFAEQAEGYVAGAAPRQGTAGGGGAAAGPIAGAGADSSAPLLPYALGADVHPDAPLRYFAFSVSDDVAKRISSRPAGTAATTTYCAIIDAAAMSHWAVVVPPLPDLDVLRAGTASILADPARYHMGARFLTGKERLQVAAASEETAATLSAYIHAASPGTMLAKAPVIQSRDEVAQNVTYLMIMAAKTDLTNMATSAVLKKLLTRPGGGASRGGLALQLGRVTAQEVAEAEEAVEDEKRKGTGGAVSFLSSGGRAAI